MDVKNDERDPSSIGVSYSVRDRESETRSLAYTAWQQSSNKHLQNLYVDRDDWLTLLPR